MALNEATRENIRLVGPFDSLRDYLRALEARGKVLRLREIDQDRYQATGLAYRLIEKFGFDKAPAILAERVKIDGEWRDGPMYGNIYGGWDIEGMVFGVDDIVEDQNVMFRRVQEKLLARIDSGGAWARIKPAVVERRKAPCKEIVVGEEDVDILQYPWFKNNPADAGRYINMGSLFIEHPALRNVGTYRCQVKGAKKIGVNPEPGQHGWQILMELKRKGLKVAKTAVALGSDPIVWSLSSTKLAGFGEDELEIAGGIRGRAVDIVKCETSDIYVPAQSEMILEGEIPLDELEEEGPYGEMYGYLGARKPKNFYMRIKTVTHRRDPWFTNSFTGVTADMLRGTSIASNYHRYKKLIPGLTAMMTHRNAPGVMIVAIKKRFAGEGMAAGQQVLANPTIKVAIVVDDDINLLNPLDVLHCMSARWQPKASVVIPQTQSMMVDPSTARHGLSSKMIIDATRQLPLEGGPAEFPAYSRALLEAGAPDLFPWVEKEWPNVMKLWEKQGGGS